MIVIAASNHVDKLDQALLRPGRFDRQVLVSPPDRDGREAILRAHAKGKPLGPDLDLADVARKTTGMTGAQLANALNEGAIIAGRAGRERDVARRPRRVAAAPVGRLPAGAAADPEGAEASSPTTRPATRSAAVCSASTRRRSSASSPADRRSASSRTRRRRTPT